MSVTASTLWQLAAQGISSWLRQVPDAQVAISTDSWLILTGEPVADFNMAYVGEGQAAEARLREICHRMAGGNLPGLVVIAPAIADELAPVAQSLGLLPVGTMPLMTYQPTKAPGSTPATGPYTVNKVQTTAELEDVKDVLSGAFQLPRAPMDRVLIPAMINVPGITFFLTHCAGQPVSAVMTTTTDHVVGIWSMGTIPEWQRQGAGRATLTAVLVHHVTRGARLFYLGATPQGKPLYDQVGFRTLEEVAVWVAGQSTQFPGSAHASAEPRPV
jgi:GNAT superfamily N-acetyltransferase